MMESQIASMEDYAEEELDQVVSIDQQQPAVMTEHLDFQLQTQTDDEEKYLN